MATPSQENLELNKRRSKIRMNITKAHTTVSTRTNFGEGKVTRTLCKQLSDGLFKLDQQINDNTGAHYYDTLRNIGVLLDEEDERNKKQLQEEKQRHEEEEEKARELAHKREKERLELEVLNAKLSKHQSKSLLSSNSASLSSSQQIPLNSNSPTTQVVIRNLGDEAKVSPFDGSPCRYRNFEEEFEGQYGQDTTLNDAAKFLAFKNLCGTYGKDIIGNLKPTQQGLTDAKKRMQEWYSEPTRIRDNVRRSFAQLKPIKNRTLTRQLTSLLITCEEGIQALKDCGTSSATINESYLNLIVQNLPQNLTAAYQRENESWDADGFIKYLRKEIKFQDKLNERHQLHPTEEPKAATRSKTNLLCGSPTYPKSSPVSPNKPLTRVCNICEGNHLTIFCDHEDVTTRRTLVIQKKLCMRCLRPGHLSKDCKSTYVCPCRGAHSKVVCPRNGVPSTNAIKPNPITTQSQNTEVKQIAINTLTADTIDNRQTTPSHLKPSTSKSDPTNLTQPKTDIITMAAESTNKTSIIESNSNNRIPSQTRKKYARSDLVSFMNTVLVNIKGQLVRVLLDNAAGRTVVEESLAKELGLEIYGKHTLSISGFNGNSTSSNRLVNATLTSLVNGQSMDLVFSVVTTLGKLMPPVCPPHLRDKLIATGYPIADSHERVPIRMIIGAESYEFIRRESIQITEDLHVVDTFFGYTLYGCTPIPNLETSTFVNFMQTASPNLLDQSLSNPTLTTIEKDYLDKFTEENVSCNDNQYSVNLPWISPVELHSYKDAALGRLKRTLTRLKKDPGLFQQYKDALSEVITNFAEPAPAIQSNRTYYLAHHCVIRLDKSTSQVRIVFDGSAHEPGHLPLNDCMFKGVNAWNSLNLFTRFRFGKTAVASDIEKAFLTIKINPADRDALRFWWIDSNGEPIAYRFTSVPFGTSASPFLLYAVLEKHLSANLEKYPTTILLIRNNFYVDDILLAFENLLIDQINQLKQEIVSIFSTASMNVRKWRSNNIDLDQQWSPGAPETIKILGYLWNVRLDTLSVAATISVDHEKSPITKRVFSSIVASVYDPMGFVAPFVVKLRLFLRKLWQEELDWDDPLSTELNEEAVRLIKDVQLVKELSVKRNILTGLPATLLVYCDASQSAIGVAAYCMNDESTSLIYAKSQLARSATIPDLELDALVKGAEVANQLCKLAELSKPHFNTSQSSLFTSVLICGDSLLNLQRLIKHPNDQRPQIALRINQIRKLVPTARFRHVLSASNIADIISRGCSMTELLGNPDWLHAPKPAEATRFDNEITNHIFAFQAKQVNCSCPRYSNFSSALRTYRLFARLILRYGKHEYYQRLTEIDLAMILMIREVQQRHFSQELEDIQNKLPIDKNSLLRNYKWALDESKLIRLQTRMIKGPNLTTDETSPSILPYNCHISDLIIKFEHDRLGHPGVDRTLAAVRSRLFIIGLRKSVRRLISHCRICRTLRGKTSTVNLGQVPRFRYDERTPAFTNVGVDIFGPLKIAMKTPGKRYGMIFTCATTRAVHLESIPNQTAEEVYLAFRKFIARRGVPRVIYSDNGLQLIAVEKRFLKLVEQISREYSKPEIRLKWLHLTPSSPWRGGFYERLIHTVKSTLTALTFKTIINDRKLETILYEIEALMNSRPLFTFEGQVVTPAHFFAGRSLVQLPRIGNTENIDKPNIIKEYLAATRHKNAVWSKFHDHYLLQLKSMHENLFSRNQGPIYKPNDVVLLKNSTPPDYWPIGIIERVQPSPDGQIRTVFLRTTDRGRTVVKARDVRTLIPLECHGEVDDPLTDAELGEPDIADPQPILVILDSLYLYPAPPEDHK